MPMPQLMHPWFGIKWAKRKEMRLKFKSWLKENEAIRLRRGAIRDDGKVFVSYDLPYKNGEHWTTKAAFEKQNVRARAQMRRLRRDPEYRQKYNSYCRKRAAERSDVRHSVRLRGLKNRKTKPWAGAEQTRRRYALKMGQSHPCSDRIKERALFAEASRLTKQTGAEHHVDHIIPLSVGGWHHHENLQVLPGMINFAKASDPFWTSEIYLDWRDVPHCLWPDHLADAYLERLYEEALLSA